MEERELVRRFGPEYEEYRRRVPALIPRLRR
jgi:protein-S-isoprenylcysteine O-methyltransferase Ste14